jgi:hypothetical protein
MALSDAILTQILAQLNALQVSQQTLQAKVRILDAVSTDPFFDIAKFQLDAIANQQPTGSPHPGLKSQPLAEASTTQIAPSVSTPQADLPSPLSLKATLSSAAPEVVNRPTQTNDKERERLLYPGRINLTSEQAFTILPFCDFHQDLRRSSLTFGKFVHLISNSWRLDFYFFSFLFVRLAN